MMQGDSYNIGIKIINNAGTPVAPEDIRDVEITLGQIRKTYSNAELTFSEGLWMFPVSQNESFGVWPGPVKAQVRVAWANGVVEGKPLYGIVNTESISKEVL